MTATNQAERPHIDVAASFDAFCQSAYDSLARISLSLDQMLGAEVTTGLAIVLGIVSLGLALIPVWSAWKKPSATIVPPVPALERNALGEEVVQMHPECLQELYGVPAPREISPAPVAQPEVPAVPEPAAESRHDVPLGLIADLSEELTQQHKAVLALKLLTEQQQRQLDSLVAQMKAQSSAFLLQGERLLRLEALTEQTPEQVADAAGSEELQRLSTFDQAIELAHQGAGAEVLMSRCGLSVSEAQLVVLVHGKPSAE
ncbi:MAG: DUF2802 domain-containing protein [Pseudomonadota bacterium]